MVGKKSALIVVGFLASLYLVACGGSPAAIGVTVSPATATVDGPPLPATNTLALTATVANDVNSAGVTWTASCTATCLSNTTTTGATFTAPVATASAQPITVTATSVHDPTKVGTATITVPAKLATSGSSTTASLNGAVGTTYSVNLNSQVTGGVPPYKNWAVAAGSLPLPACLTLNAATGIITFTSAAGEAACAAGGPYDPSFTYSDSGTPTALTGTTIDYDINITPDPPLALAATLPAVTAGVALTTESVAAVTPGGAAPLNYMVTAGALPAWATLNPLTGAITGTPTVAGTYPFTVTLTDTFGDLQAQQNYSLVVNVGTANKLVISTAPPSSVTAGAAFGATVKVEDIEGNVVTSSSAAVAITSTAAGVTGTTTVNASSGVATFTNLLLDTVGSYTLTASSGTLASATSGNIAVVAGTASKLAFTTIPSGNVTAGSAFTAVVQVQDANGNLVASATPSVTLSSTATGVSGTLTANAVAGIATFSTLAFNTSGTYTLTAASGGLTSSTSGNVVVVAGTASKLVFTTPPPSLVTAGANFGGTVQVQDSLGNLVTTSTASVAITSTATGVSGTTTVTAVAGIANFTSLVFNTVGSYTLTAASTGLTSATTSSISVTASGATHLVVTAISPEVAGTPFSVTVTAADGFNNTATNYLGTIHFTTTDPSGSKVLPADYTFQAGNNGVKVFTSGVTLITEGNQTITATDAGNSLSGVSPTIAVSAAAINKLVVSATSPQVAGTGFSVTVTAEDTYGNTETGDNDTIALTSTDGQAASLGSAPLVSGAHTFSGVILKTAQITVITATDSSTSLAGNTANITVNAGTATKLLVSTPSSHTAGVSLPITVTAEDQFNNTVTGYGGTVHFTGTDPLATIVNGGLPANSTLTSGTGSFTATLETAGSQTITATDTSTAITGFSTIQVSAAAASKLVFTPPPTSATTSVAFNVTVTAQDPYGNTATATGATDAVKLTGTGPSSTTFGPAIVNLSGGTTIFSVTLGFSGTWSLTAADNTNGAVTSAVASNINVSTALTITTSSLNPLDAGQNPTQVMAASGGSGNSANWTWTWAAGSTGLPPGLSMGLNTGAIGGNPTTAGTYNVNITVSDSVTSTQKTTNFSITIYPALSLPTVTLPTGYTGNVVYNGGTPATITGTGGSGSTTISVTGGGLPADGLSASPNNEVLSISGTPTGSSGYSVPFTAKLTDSTTNNSITMNYSITVVVPQAPTFTPTNLALPNATQGQAYGPQTITATGGVGPNYTWTVNSNVLSNNTPVVISNGISVSTTGNNVLTISGTPSTTTQVQLPITVKDNTTNLSTSTTSPYTITVNASGGTISGSVNLNINCVNSNNLPIFTVTATPTTGSPVTAQTTHTSPGYSLTSLPFGTYTLTVTSSGAASQVYSPVSYTSLTISSGTPTLSGENFTAEVGYNVSGTVTYAGALTSAQEGQTYLSLQSSCGGNQGGSGTSISAATLSSSGNFFIHGVPPGSYSLSGWMDAQGFTSSTTGWQGQQGQSNVNDPANTVTPAVNVTSANVSGVNLTLQDPTYSAPNPPTINSIIPTETGWFISYTSPTASSCNSNTSNCPEDANEYQLQWAVANSTDADGPICTLGSGGGGGQFATVAGSHIFYANGSNQTFWIVNNTSMGAGTFTSGTAYCFQARAINTLYTAGTNHSTWSTYNDGIGNATPVAPNSSAVYCSSNCANVAATVNVPAGITIPSGAPLYMGIIQFQNGSDNPSAIYTAPVLNETAGAGSTVQFTIPNGTNYAAIGILDLNNDGVIDAGDVTNVINLNLTNPLTFNGTGNTSTLTLPSANAQTYVITDYSSCGTGCSNYTLEFAVNQSNKLPVNVQLASGPNVISPADMQLCTNCNGGGNVFAISDNLPGSTVNVGDTYTFNVTYSDGSSGQVTGAVVGWNNTSTVTGPSIAASALHVTNLSGDQPNFGWTDAASSMLSTDYYQFQLQQNSSCSGNCTIWQIPGNGSKSNGFSSSILAVNWGVDPTGGSDLASVTKLTSTDQYNMQIQVQDANGNWAQTSTTFTAP